MEFFYNSLLFSCQVLICFLKCIFENLVPSVVCLIVAFINASMLLLVFKFGFSDTALYAGSTATIFIFNIMMFCSSEKGTWCYTIRKGVFQFAAILFIEFLWDSFIFICRTLVYFFECITAADTFYFTLFVILFCLSYAIFLLLTQPDYILFFVWTLICVIGSFIAIVCGVVSMTTWLYDVIFNSKEDD